MTMTRRVARVSDGFGKSLGIRHSENGEKDHNFNVADKWDYSRNIANKVI